VTNKRKQEQQQHNNNSNSTTDDDDADKPLASSERLVLSMLLNQFKLALTILNKFKLIQISLSPCI
jgi:hypothetical protein